MSTAADQNLLLGKLKRAVDGTDSYSTANTSLGAQNDGSSETKMSDFSISSCGSNIGGYAYLWEQTTEGYYIDVQNAGSLWKSTIGSANVNFSWAKGWADSVIEISTTQGYSASFEAKAISNARTGDGSENPFPAGSNNIVATLDILCEISPIFFSDNPSILLKRFEFSIGSYSNPSILNPDSLNVDKL